MEISPGGAKHSARVLLKPFPTHALLWLRKCHTKGASVIILQNILFICNLCVILISIMTTLILIVNIYYLSFPGFLYI